MEEVKEEKVSQRSIFDNLKANFSRVSVKCFHCGNMYKADKEPIEKFQEVQKLKGIEEALKLDLGINCPKCKANRWSLNPKKRTLLKFGLNLKEIPTAISDFLSKCIDLGLWFLAWLEYRRQILLRNWWFDYKNIVCRGGALLGLLGVIYYANNFFKVEFYQTAICVAVLYAIMKFSKN